MVNHSIRQLFGERKKVASDFTYLLSHTNNFEIQYNIPIQIKKSAIYIEIKDDAINKPEHFWNTYRKDSLDSRSQKTYLALDSISSKKRIESRIVVLERLELEQGRCHLPIRIDEARDVRFARHHRVLRAAFPRSANAPNCPTLESDSAPPSS